MTVRPKYDHNLSWYDPRWWLCLHRMGNSWVETLRSVWRTRDIIGRG